MDGANPYEASGPLVPLQETAKEKARRLLSRPATALIIMSSIHSVFAFLYAYTNTMLIVDGRSAGISTWILLALNSIQFASLVLICIGGAKMGHLESLTMGKVGAFLACIPFLSPFYVAGIPFGIWALKLLDKPEIQAAFEKGDQD